MSSLKMFKRTTAIVMSLTMALLQPMTICAENAGKTAAPATEETEITWEARQEAVPIIISEEEYADAQETEGEAEEIAAEEPGGG